MICKEISKETDFLKGLRVCFH